MNKFFKNWRSDLPASLVVFLVALPLCLGIALASTGDEPRLFSGIIAGVVGGIVVGFASGSKLGVSGPAAGLITIVIATITTLGSFEAFLLAVVLSGVIQLIAGFLKAGVIGNYFPSSVIKGMLAAIGLTLILKEIPHAVGYDVDFVGDEAFFQVDGHNTFSEIFLALNKISPGAIIISVISILILILFDKPFLKKIALFKILPGALFVVLLGIGTNLFFQWFYPDLYLNSKHLVTLPKANSWSDFVSFFTFPDFSALKNPQVYIVAGTIALVGSIETLLSAEATDKLDPEKNHTSRDKELKAQGLGNIISGLLGGLPITQVIVRSSANINSGGKSKLSAILHGFFLFSSVLLIPSILNLIPLASLAGLLVMVGYKLSNINLFKQMYKLGWDQFLPFLSTIIAILLTDLLRGIGIGMLFALLLAIYSKSQKFKNYQQAFLYFIHFIWKREFKKNLIIQKRNSEVSLILLNKITFLNKLRLNQVLDRISENGKIIIDGTNCKKIDIDILEIIQNFINHRAQEKYIQVEIINIEKIKK